MKTLSTKIAVLMVVALFSMGTFVTMDNAYAKRKHKSQAELDAAKKAGDLSVEEAEKTRAAFGKEADEANIESFESEKKGHIGKGDSTYGVAGFDYLTGVGKVASDPSKINEKTFKIKSANKSPLEKLMKKRFKNKWTGQYNDTYSGEAKHTGVTEVWFRTHTANKKLGADYNQWVNQWNNITRPRHGGVTQVAGADPDQGAHWFSFYCIHCHGWTGKGDGPTAAKLDPRPRNLTNGSYTNYISNLDLFTVIKGGGIARNLSSSMPPWGNVLQDQDIWNVVAFIRTLPQKEKFKASSSDVTAANASKNQDFQDRNEELELAGVMAGRGGKQVGGYSSIGGGRLSSMRVGINGRKTSGGKGENAASEIGDWAMDTKTNVH